MMLVVAVSFLGYVGYTKYSLPLDSATFTPDALYRGTQTEAFDPREYYNTLNGLTLTTSVEDGCIVAVVSEKNAIEIKTAIGNYLPLVYTGTEKDYAKLISKEGEGLFSDKQQIVMPVSSSKFKNSNLKDSTITETEGKHNIEIVKGDKILIVFEDVMTWWCHAHNASHDVQHDSRVGKGSRIESIRGGAVLGVANKSTKVKVYKIRDELSKEGKKVEDVDSMSQLQQIDAGKFLIEEKVVVL